MLSNLVSSYFTKTAHESHMVAAPSLMNLRRNHNDGPTDPMDMSKCYWTTEYIHHERRETFLADLAYQMAPNGDKQKAQSLYDRIMSMPYAERVFEYKRLESNGWKPYYGPNYYPDLAFQKGGQKVYDYLKTFDEKDRGMVYTSLYQLDFKEVPYVGQEDTFWASAAKQVGSHYGTEISNAILEADPKHRMLDFFLWSTYNFNIDGNINAKTHWGDKAY